MRVWPRVARGHSETRALPAAPAVPAPRETGNSATSSPLPAIRRRVHAPDRKPRHEGTRGRRAGLPGRGSRESITYQFSCIHWMASFSLNCFSNSYSCKANTDMFIGADLRSRYVFSTQNKIICKALDFGCSPVCFPHPPPSVLPSPLALRGPASPSLSQLHPGASIACAAAAPSSWLRGSPPPGVRIHRRRK